MSDLDDPVQGYSYSNTYDQHGLNGKICQIVSRGEPRPEFDHTPMFVVQFGDGSTTEVLGECLHPWFPS